MQFFIDSADIGQLEEAAATGLVDGVTTNPSLIAKSGRKIAAVIAEICELIPGPISAEATASDYETLLAEGRFLARIASNVVVKLPLTWEGLKATRTLAEEGTAVNVTLCFSAVQALLAAKAGAAYISPFVGRLDDHGSDGIMLIHDIRAIYDQYGFETKILAASIRTSEHVRAAALAGADCATLPPATFHALVKHPLTDKGLEAFMSDWAKTGQSIL
jgi:transaldolase